ncbi:hypothetical protein COO20_02150 [Thalassospira marina]|uniref:Uncharacterized protein n=1 Tax=Thalassospira marina TaxID=2048283 RepID=A0A2N3KZS0_9PROT|nr:hypothetical protein COO20_02150 [Thalassospira marina]
MRPLPETAAGFLFSGFDGDLVGIWWGFGGDLPGIWWGGRAGLGLCLGLDPDFGFELWFGLGIQLLGRGIHGRVDHWFFGAVVK